MLMERTADPSASLGMTKGGAVFWSALDADGENCRSLHGTPGQVGFARDDKGERSVVEGPDFNRSIALIARLRSWFPGSIPVGFVRAPLLLHRSGRAAGSSGNLCKSYLRDFSRASQSLGITLQPDQHAKELRSTGAESIPFYLSTKDLNCSRMLSLMHVSEGDEIPLYMQVVQQILRSMGNKEFDYSAFKRALHDKQKTEFTQGQNMPLTLRIQLLEAMLLECQNRKQVRGLVSVKAHFEPGTITIVDLTDPFINPSSASALFDIALSLYLETEIPSGKLLVLDEAHKVNPIAKHAVLTDSISVMESQVPSWRQFSQSSDNNAISAFARSSQLKSRR